MATTFTETPNTKSHFGDQLKIACPIYVNVGSELAKEIINELRLVADDGDTAAHFSDTVRVVNNSTSAIERRLKMDFRTLRYVLFDSWTRGIPLDLAMRIQNELPNFRFIDRDILDTAYESSLANYEYFSDAET